MNLHVSPADLIIIAGYLLGVVALGLWAGRGNRDLSDYAVAGRTLPWWLVLFSIVATETSTVTFLSVPGISYKKDLTFLQLPFGFILGRYLVCFFLLPAYFQGNLFTAYQVLERRFGGLTKKAASLLFVVTRSLADGLRLYLTAIVLHAMTDMDMSLAVAVIGGATIAYTFFGGIRAVVWTDFVQFLIYIAGAVLAGWNLLRSQSEGWQGILAAANDAGKLRVFDFSMDYTLPHTFLAGLIGGAFLSFGTHGTDQMTVQRLLSSRSQKEAGRALWMSGWVVLIQFLLFLLLGIGLWKFYSGREFPTADAIMATFIVHEMPTGVVGVTLAAVFAAAMSTLSSSLNSSATATVTDLLATVNADDPSSNDRAALSRTRLWTVVFGVVQMSIAWLAVWRGLERSIVDIVLAIAGFVTGIILGVFFLGIFFKHVQQRTALFGMIGGMLVLGTLKATTDLAWPWFAVVGSLSTVAIGLVAATLQVATNEQGGG